MNGSCLRPNVASEPEFLLFCCPAVLDQDKVKHYKVQQLENGHHFLSNTKSFPTLKELVEYYSKQSEGLGVHLREPCKKVQEHTNSPRFICFLLFLKLSCSCWRSRRPRSHPPSQIWRSSAAPSRCRRGWGPGSSGKCTRGCGTVPSQSQ